jgi:hypothetical protein
MKTEAVLIQAVAVSVMDSKAGTKALQKLFKGLDQDD